MSALVSFGAGLLFAIGLAFSGMTDPVRVIGFLDFTGAWDPRLALVMGSALAVTAPLYALARRRGRPVLGPSLDPPPRAPIDTRLFLGAGLFGVGWGLGGFCPGPAVVSLATGASPVLLFVGTLLAGVVLVDRLFARPDDTPGGCF